MWFWSLLGWLIGVPFVVLAGLTALYMVCYIISKVFGFAKDLVKYPTYYRDEVKKRFKNHKDDFIFLGIIYVVVIVIMFISYLVKK